MTFLGGGGGGGGNLVTATSAIISSVAAPVAFTTLDNNNPKGLTALVKGCKVTLPAANSGGFTPGPVNFPMMVNPGSWPIRVYNNGTPGTDAMLEAVLPAGCQFSPQLAANSAGSAFGVAYTAAAGLWNKQFYLNTAAPIKGLQALSPGIVGPSAVTGTFTASVDGPGIVWVSGTLGIWVFIDSSNNVRGLPYQLSADGVTNQIAGTNTQIQASGGNTLTSVVCSPCSATQVVVRWFDSTNTKNQFCVVTITPGVLPSAPSIAIGAVIDDTATLATAGNRVTAHGQLSQDFGNANQWFVGFTGATLTNRLRAYFLTVNTGASTLVISATADYDSGHATTATAIPAIFPSVAANQLLALGNTTILSLLTYNAGAITATWTFASNISQPQNGIRIDLMDITQGLFSVTLGLGTGGSNNWYSNTWIFRMNLATGALIESEKLGEVINDWDDGNSLGNPVATAATAIWMGDGELLFFQGTSITIYHDYKTYWKSYGDQETVANPVAAIAPSQYVGITQKLELSLDAAIYGLGIHLPTRRVCVAYGITNDTVLRLAFFEFPKR